MDFKSVLKKYFLILVYGILYVPMAFLTLQRGYLCNESQMSSLARMSLIIIPIIIILISFFIKNIKIRNIVLGVSMILTIILFINLPNIKYCGGFIIPEIPAMEEDPIVLMADEFGVPRGKNIEFYGTFYNNYSTAEFTPVIDCIKIPSGDFVVESIKVQQGYDERFDLELKKQKNKLTDNCTITFKHPNGHEEKENFTIMIR